MKKTFLFLMLFVLISGFASAQYMPLFFPAPSGLDSNFNLLPNAGLEWEGGQFNMFDSLYAPPIMSTQARYSAGVFRGDIDNYLDIIFHDRYVGTFVFAGAFPSGEVVNQSESGFIQNGLSFGMGRTINCSYIAFYYGGNILDSIHIKNDEAENYNSIWRNRFAILFSNPTLGAFRLDANINMEMDQEKTDDGNDLNRYLRNAPSLALSWGGLSLGSFIPYVTIGYQFPRTETSGYVNSGDYIEATYTSSSYLALQTGLHYEIDENRWLRGDLSFVFATQERYSGDAEIIGTETDPIAPFRRGGGWGLGLRTVYRQEVTVNNFSFGFSPSVSAAFRSTKTPGELEGDKDTLNDYFVQILTGVDLGVRYRPNSTFSFYSGLSLRVLNWGFNYASEINGNATERYQRLDGILFMPGSLASYNNYKGDPVNNYLGFGMVIEPNANLSVGMGLNSFIDRFFIIKPSTLSIETGEFFENRGEFTNGAWLMGLFRGIKLDLTIRYRF